MAILLIILAAVILIPLIAVIAFVWDIIAPMLGIGIISKVIEWF